MKAYFYFCYFYFIRIRCNANSRFLFPSVFLGHSNVRWQTLAFLKKRFINYTNILCFILWEAPYTLLNIWKNGQNKWFYCGILILEKIYFYWTIIKEGYYYDLFVHENVNVPDFSFLLNIWRLYNPECIMLSIFWAAI